MLGKIGPMELAIIGIPFYFVPLIIAAIRHHPKMLGIFLVNFFLGWTFLGWVGVLIWSLWKIDRIPSSNASIEVPSSPRKAGALTIAEERFAKGEITADEFDRIKSRLV